MRVALIDPSLFTLPHDCGLARGLGTLGHTVSLYGRRTNKEDSPCNGVNLVPAFYPISSGKVATSLPKSLRLSLKGIEHLLCMARLHGRLARQERPDIVHFMWLPLPLVDRKFLAAFKKIAPLVLTVHDTMPFNGEPSSRLQFIAAGACYGIFDRLIVHTEQGYARLLSQGVLPDRITRLPVGLSDEPPAANAQPDSMEGPLTFLLFGSIRRYKGLDVLIEAFARLPRDLRASVRLRVVGKAFLDLGPFLELARERGVMEQISIEPGFVAAADVPHLFGPGVVAVFPYREIEASGVLPNAIAGGRPIIASRIGSFGETLEDGVHGMLVPPGDVDALAGAMARLAADREFAARCAARVRELFTIMPSWETIAQRTAEVYTKAITTRCSRRDAAA